MSSILELSSDDEEIELTFNCNHHVSLSNQQNYRIMFESSHYIANLFLNPHFRKSFEIIKRL